jgi:tetratricopeptide (TPR) repeat protein
MRRCAFWFALLWLASTAGNGRAEETPGEPTAAGASVEPDRRAAARAAYDRGKSAFDGGRYDAAVADFAEAIKLDPNRDHLFYVRACAWYGKADYDRAVEDLNEAIRLKPTDSMLFATRGDAELMRRNFDSARKDADEALRLDPKSDFALVVRADALRLTEDYDGARRDINNAILHGDALHPGPLDARILACSGDLWFAKGDNARALAHLNGALGIEPKLVRALVTRGHVRLDELKLDGALSDFDAAIRLDSKNPRAILGRAEVQTCRHQYDAALDGVNKVIAIAPHYVLAYALRGRIHVERGEMKEGIADCTEAIRLNSRCVSAYCVRAQAAVAEGDVDSASKDIDAALEITPNHPAALASRGLLRYQQGDNAQATQDLTAAIGTRDDPRVRFTLACIARGENDYPAAIASLEKAIQLDPEYADALGFYALILAACPAERLRDPEAAIRHATKACDLTGRKDSRMLGSLAAAQAESGNFDEAVRLQTDAIELAETDDDKGSLGRRLALYRSHKPYRIK